MTTTTSDARASVDRADAGDPRIARSRARVLDAARELLVELGLTGVTVDAISERSGVAKSTLYRHWDSRNDLLVDLVNACMPTLSMPDREQGFAACLNAHLDEIADALADESYALAIASLATLKRQMPELAEAMTDERSEKTQFIDAILEIGRDEGVIGDEVTAERLVALLIGPLIFDAAFQDGIGDTECERSEHLHALARDAATRFLASLDRA